MFVVALLSEHPERSAIPRGARQGDEREFAFPRMVCENFSCRASSIPRPFVAISPRLSGLGLGLCLSLSLCPLMRLRERGLSEGKFLARFVCLSVSFSLLLYSLSSLFLSLYLATKTAEILQTRRDAASTDRFQKVSPPSSSREERHRIPRVNLTYFSFITHRTSNRASWQ